MNIDQKIYRYMYVCLVKKHVHVITVNEKEFQKVFNMGKANSEADQEKRGWGGGRERYTTTTHPLQFLVESIHDISFNDSKFLFKHFKGAVIHDWMFFSSCKTYATARLLILKPCVNYIESMTC